MLVFYFIFFFFFSFFVLKGESVRKGVFLLGVSRSVHFHKRFLLDRSPAHGGRSGSGLCKPHAAWKMQGVLIAVLASLTRLTEV